MAVNFLLLAAKLWGIAVSQSYSVLASAADSVVDIASQAVLALADWQVGKVDPSYPVGKTRLQTVAVIACAVIMSFATLAVIQESAKSLYSGVVTGDVQNLFVALSKSLSTRQNALWQQMSLTVHLSQAFLLNWTCLQCCTLFWEWLLA